MATNRRNFIIRTAAGVAAASVTVPALSAEPQLAEDDPIAIALGYKIDANEVDVAQYPKRAGEAGATQFCSNCALYGDRGNGYGTCSAIPGKLVAGPGWCNAWIPQA